MLALVEITHWHWIGFIACVLVFLALDLGVFHRQAHVVKFKEALAWTTVWFSLAMVFAGALRMGRGREESLEFLTGYLIELSLSMDNVFVIALIFSYFRIPSEFQHRVLFWGIMGALVMRGVMIAAGAALIERFQWTLYVFGLFLVFTGIKMMLVNDDGVEPEKNPVLRLTKKLFPVTTELHGQRFTIRQAGRLVLTPLALVLVLVETTDLIFALDSIPAIFAVTTKPFIVFTSNVFAILGLRSLYFVLAGAIGLFRYLKIGLSVVLVFIGVKMLLDPHTHAGEAAKYAWQVKIPIGLSLTIVVAIILGSILLSLWVARRERRASASKAD
jgi:tellurite resistance protein TerC